MIVYLRLAFGTACVLAPGWAVARAFGSRSWSAVLAWACAAVFAAWALVFTFHRSIHLAAAVLAAIFVGALIVARRRPREPWDSDSPGRPRSNRSHAWLVGLVLGWLLWPVEGAVTGDGLFHEARVRKLVDLTSLHLRSVDEFKDGGLHPGYAFPLWHGLLALVSWFSGVDPGIVVRHLPSLLAPVACAVVWESGVAVFRSRSAGWSLLALTLAVFCFGPGHGGSWATMALPGTAARQLLVPAAIALFFRRQWLATAAVFGALSLTHPTYALFLLIPLGAFVLLRLGEWRSWLPVLAAAAVPLGAAVVWLKPIVDETISHNPGPAERLRAIKHYGNQLVVANEHHYRLAPQVFGRTGVVAVAALILLPLAALVARRRSWAAFAVGGTLAVLVLTEVPWLFVQFSNAVSLSQSRRVAGFAPLAFALVGSLALAVRSAKWLPLALVAGIVMQLLWPGDFDYGLRNGGPAFATWIALVGGAVALVIGWIRPVRLQEHYWLGAAAAALLVLPVYVHGAWHWSPRVSRDPDALSPGLVRRLRTVVPRGAVVLAPIQTSYRVTADAPLYVVALPVPHVANTRANDPYGRVRAVRHWLRTNDPRVARRYGATWAIRAGRLYRLPQ
jgi:hypothetical protein